MKKIGVMTTGGDCSGLNTVIYKLMTAAKLRGWDIIGIKDGTDGLVSDTPNIIELNNTVFPIEYARNAGSFLGNGNANIEHFRSAIQDGGVSEFNNRIKKSIKDLKLDALVLLGGNGSISLAHKYSEIYSDVQLICIPKTIDKDIPLTENTIGFSTASQQLVSFCDQLLFTAHSHHRWFVVQTMGRATGALALNAGVAMGADAILIPEIKFDIDSLVNHIQNQNKDYGIILVSEGISLRGHSGRAGDMISRKLTAADIQNRAVFPEHIQRAGDTSVSDRLLAAGMVDCAISAIENNETNVITALTDGVFETVGLKEFFDAGIIEPDPNLPDTNISNAYIEPDDPLLSIADNLGIYIGELK